MSLGLQQVHQRARPVRALPSQALAGRSVRQGPRLVEALPSQAMGYPAGAAPATAGGGAAFAGQGNPAGAAAATAGGGAASTGQVSQHWEPYMAGPPRPLFKPPPPPRYQEHELMGVLVRRVQDIQDLPVTEEAVDFAAARSESLGAGSGW